MITHLWSEEKEIGLVPYLMQLSSTNEYMYALYDEDYVVRAFFEPGLPRLLQSIECGDEWETVQSYITSNGIDVGLVGANILLQAASCGNVDVLERLIGDCGVPESTCGKDRRNILFTALLHKQTYLAEHIVERYTSLATESDAKGFNMMHYIVMTGDTDYLREVLYVRENILRVAIDAPKLEGTAIADLVDTRNKRYGRADMEKIFSIPTPLEWARRTKKSDMVHLLETFEKQLRVAVMILDLTYDTEAARDDISYLKEIIRIFVQVVEWSLDMCELYRVDTIYESLRDVTGICCQDGKTVVPALHVREPLLLTCCWAFA